MLHSIAILVIFLSMFAFSSAEGALSYKMNTVEDYEAFTKKYPPREYDKYTKNKIMEFELEKLQQAARAKRKAEKKKKLLARVNKTPARSVQLDMLRNYEIGVTTLQLFREDGWHSVDAMIGKIGVVAFLVNGANAEYTLGTHSVMLEKNSPDVLNSMYEFNLIETTAMGTPLTFSQVGQYSDHSKPGTTKVICTLTFKDMKLESKDCTF